MGRSANSRAYLPRTIVSNLHYDGKRLVPWLITRTRVKKDAQGNEYTVQVQERRENGRLIVLRTNRLGERTIIEQMGHPIPEGLASAIGARVKYLPEPEQEAA
jgi:hypothetical protein